MSSLGIAIDGGRYVKIDSRIGDLPHNVRLRTIRPDQSVARLVFYNFRNGRPREIRSHLFSGLKAQGDRPVELKLRIDRISFAIWDIRISHGSRHEDLRVRTGIGLWPLPVAGVLLLAVLFWLFVIGFGPGPVPVDSTGTDTQAETPLPRGDEGTEGSGGSGRETVADEPNESPASDETASTGPQSTSGIGDTETDESVGTDTTPAPSGTVGESSPVTEVALPEAITLYFDPESALLSARARSELERFAGAVPEDRVIIVEGHSADYGTERGRQALSLLRARNTAAYLGSLLPPGTEIIAEGFGIDRPATRDREQQHLNRRVWINILEEAE